MKITAFADSDIASSTAGGSQSGGPAGGDLGGGYPAPQVTGIGGYPLTTPGVRPANGDIPTFDTGTGSWDYAPPSATGYVWRPLMASDGTNWWVVVDGSGNAIMV
jgi:hypothetical protein